MEKTYFIQILTGFLGSLGFSVLFNIRGTKLIIAAFGGFISWGLFLLLGTFFESEPLRYFFSAVAVTVYAEIFARIKKTPTTTFLVASIIPLIPGGVLYHTMNYALKNDWANFSESAFYTIKLSLSLAVGIIVVSSVLRMVIAVINYVKKVFLAKKSV